MQCGQSFSNVDINFWLTAYEIMMFLELREEKTENINRYLMGFSGGDSGEEPACQCRRHKRLGFYPPVGKIPWRRQWQPTPVFLPEKFHGQRSLAATVHGVAKSQTRFSDGAQPLLKPWHFWSSWRKKIWKCLWYPTGWSKILHSEED